jgi:hypothetical protein
VFVKGVSFAVADVERANAKGKAIQCAASTILDVSGSKFVKMPHISFQILSCAILPFSLLT